MLHFLYFSDQTLFKKKKKFILFVFILLVCSLFYLIYTPPPYSSPLFTVLCTSHPSLYRPYRKNFEQLHPQNKPILFHLIHITTNTLTLLNHKCTNQILLKNPSPNLTPNQQHPNVQFLPKNLKKQPPQLQKNPQIWKNPLSLIKTIHFPQHPLGLIAPLVSHGPFLKNSTVLLISNVSHWKIHLLSINCGQIIMQRHQQQLVFQLIQVVLKN